MAGVGFTTGSLYKSAIPFEERASLYYSLGADAIELSFSTPSELLTYQPSRKFKKSLDRFPFVSIHAPWKEVNYKNNLETKKILEHLNYLSREVLATGIVLHPDVVEDFDVLEKSELPFLIENMDRRKKYGTSAEHIREIKENHNFEFVFDVQHAYEHANTMGLAKELIDIIGNRLKHMHVSGNTSEEIHVPVFSATNREDITEILKMNLQVPKILEGILLGNINYYISSEINYVKFFGKKE